MADKEGSNNKVIDCIVISDDDEDECSVVVLSVRFRLVKMCCTSKPLEVDRGTSTDVEPTKGEAHCTICMVKFSEAITIIETTASRSTKVYFTDLQ